MPAGTDRRSRRRRG